MVLIYIELYLKYKQVQQNNDNNLKSTELLEKAFDSHMESIYSELHKLKK